MIDVTYVYFKILLVCSLARKKSIAVVGVLIVCAISWNRGGRSMTCGARALGELTSLIVKWGSQVCRRVARVDLVCLVCLS
jgi:hypothetical protein